jgi:large subunit ribosomal protein L13
MAVDKTFVPKGKVEGDWILMDAAGQGIGRLATQIAGYLLGKHKAIYTPGVEMGDFVVVINASQLAITGKRLDEKNYYHHSNYPGGLRTTNLRDQMKNHPDRVIRAAVWGMLPHNKLGRQLIKNVKIYAGPEHPHQAQNPKVIEGA